MAGVTAERVDERTTRSSSGSAGSAARPRTGSRRARRRRGSSASSSSSSATTAARRRTSSRITRLSYHRREYVELAIEAQAAWREVEAASGEHDPDDHRRPRPRAPGRRRVDRRLRRRDDRGRRRRSNGSTTSTSRGAGRSGGSTPGTRAIFQADARHRRPGARQRGPPAARARRPARRCCEHARVAAIARPRRRARGRARGRPRVHRRARSCSPTDAWTNDLLGAARRTPLPLSVTREQVTWFEADDPAAFEPERFPIWIWLDQPSFYGFPTYRGPRPEGRRGRRRPRDDGRDRATFVTDPDCLDRVERSSPAHLPGALGRPAQTKTCLYTLTPDRDFVLDRVPEHPGVIVALGAAHAYKFAALFGTLLADLALDPARRPPASGSTCSPSIDRRSPRPAATNLVGSALIRRANRVARSRAACEPSALQRTTPRPAPCGRPRRRRRSRCDRASPPIARPARRRGRSSPRRSIPAGPARRRRTTLILHVGTDQDLETLNPWQLDHGRRLRGLRAQLRAARRASTRTSSRRPASPTRWESSADKMTHTFKIRDGHEVVRRRAGDVRGRALDLPVVLDAVADRTTATSAPATSSRT